MHPAGFEPAVSHREADYESDAFGHLATDAYLILLQFHDKLKTSNKINHLI